MNFIHSLKLYYPTSNPFPTHGSTFKQTSESIWKSMKNEWHSPRRSDWKKIYRFVTFFSYFSCDFFLCWFGDYWIDSFCELSSDKERRKRKEREWEQFKNMWNSSHTQSSWYQLTFQDFLIDNSCTNGCPSHENVSSLSSFFLLLARNESLVLKFSKILLPLLGNIGW